MDLLEPITADLEGHLRRQLHRGDLLMVLLASDLDRDGRYAHEWLALIDERLLVLRVNGGAPEVESVPLAQVRRVQTRTGVGSGTLVVELPDGATRELIRFSQGSYFKFSAVPQAVEAALAEPVAADGAEPEAPPVVPPRVDHCPTCGRALRPGTRVCDHCIRKRETFWRLFSYVRPYKAKAVVGFALTLAVTGIGPLPPLLNAVLIDDVIAPVIAGYIVEVDGKRQQVVTPGAPRTPQAENLELLGWVVLGLLAIHFGRMVINGVRSYTLGWLGQRITYDLQMESSATCSCCPCRSTAATARGGS